MISHPRRIGSLKAGFPASALLTEVSLVVKSTAANIHPAEDVNVGPGVVPLSRRIGLQERLPFGWLKVCRPEQRWAAGPKD